MRVDIKTPAEVDIMRTGGKILAKVLHEVGKAVRPGITTLELDSLAEKLIRAAGATPSFLNYGREFGSPFPATLCTSVNSTVVHGIPSQKKLLEGDIIGLDLGCWYENFCTDMAITVPVGKVDEVALRLIQVTKKSLQVGLACIKDGTKTGDVGAIIQAEVEGAGFSVVRQLVGHGVGRAVHQDPQVPNFGKKGTGSVLQAGMTIAVEPMVNFGKSEVEVLDDGWTVVTHDGSLSAHFEHTVLVTERGCEILTAV